MGPEDDKSCRDSKFYAPYAKDLYIQGILSSVIGVSAFVIFCVSALHLPRIILSFGNTDPPPKLIRPRWPTLYAARKRRLDPSLDLPALPNTFFGWMPKLYSVTEEQILATAGLDAFVV